MTQTTQDTRHIPMTPSQRRALKELLRFSIERQVVDVRRPYPFARFPFKEVAKQSRYHLRVEHVEPYAGGAIGVVIICDFRGRHTLARSSWIGSIGRHGGIRATNWNSKRHGRISGFNAMNRGWHY